MNSQFSVIKTCALLLSGLAVSAHADDAMIAVAAGSFQMGGSATAQTQPVHAVQIKPFALAKNPVTRGEFEKFIEATHYDAGKGWRKPFFKQSAGDPVINVSWNDAQAYIAWLNKTTDGHYRLPTEAEWEYAARAGTSTAYYWGEDIGKALANCNDCGSEWDGERTSPVASFPANAWGLFDMGGNAAQWTQDCFSENYQNAPADGSAMLSGDCKYRVIRGGGWSDPTKAVRVDAREGNLPDFRYMNVGFRLAKDL